MFLESYNCVLCQEGVEESRNHLFLICTFARECWSLLGLNLPLQCSFPEVILRMKTHLQTDFFNAVILMCWTIWGARNNIIFNGRHQSINVCRRVFMEELTLTSLRAKAKQPLCFINGSRVCCSLAGQPSVFCFLFFLSYLLFSSYL